VDRRKELRFLESWQKEHSHGQKGDSQDASKAALKKYWVGLGSEPCVNLHYRHANGQQALAALNDMSFFVPDLHRWQAGAAG
jgi:hypothetical protein